jgi:hypothetical protein
MRVVLELRALAPAPGRAGGLEEQSATLARAMVKHAGEHDLVLVFTYVCEDAVQRLHDRFPDLSENPDFHLARLPLADSDDSDGRWLRRSAALLRESALLQLRPDVILSAPFGRSAGAADLSALRPVHVPVAMALSDDQIEEQASTPAMCDLLLVFSERDKRELCDLLKISADKIVTIGQHSDEKFASRKAPPGREQSAADAD